MCFIGWFRPHPSINHYLTTIRSLTHSIYFITFFSKVKLFFMPHLNLSLNSSEFALLETLLHLSIRHARNFRHLCNAPVTRDTSIAMYRCVDCLKSLSSYLRTNKIFQRSSHAR